MRHALRHEVDRARLRALAADAGGEGGLKAALYRLGSGAGLAARHRLATRAGTCHARAPRRSRDGHPIVTAPLDDKKLRRAIKSYREALSAARAQGDTTESQLRHAFAALLRTVTPAGWEFHEETSPAGDASKRFDGLVLKNAVQHGLWEAKDPDDRDLRAEADRKRKKGYPLDNALFENTRVALLYQDGREVPPGRFAVLPH